MNPEPLIPVDFRREAPGYWIRRFLPKSDAFVLAAAGEGRKEFVAMVDPKSPGRARVRELLIESLFGRNPRLEPVRLLVRRAGPADDPEEGAADPGKVFFITDALQPRLARDGGAGKTLGRHGRNSLAWSDGLEEAVDRHGRIWIADAAFRFFSAMTADGFARVQERAAGTLPEELRQSLPGNLPAALRGNEGTLFRRYHPSLPLSLQVERAPTGPQRVNFSIQRALIEEFATGIGAGDPALAQAQARLLSSGALLAANPHRPAETLRMQTLEAARRIGSQVLAGLMELNGAGAAAPDFDELSVPREDGSFGRREGLHEEIMRELEPHPIASSPDLARKTAAYLEMGRSRLARYDSQARMAVCNEQMKTASEANAKTAGQPETLVSAPLDGLGAVVVGHSVATAADHAHRVITESERLPGF